MGVTLSAMKIGEICFVEAGGVGLVPKILEAPDPVPGAIFCFCVSAGTNRRQATALVSWPSISPILIADSVTPTVSRQKDGKLRIVYAGWDNAKVVQAHQVSELRAS